MHVWETYFKELLNKTADSELELSSSVREKTEVVEITDTEMMAAMKKMKKGRRPVSRARSSPVPGVVASGE